MSADDVMRGNLKKKCAGRTNIATLRTVHIGVGANLGNMERSIASLERCGI